MTDSDTDLELPGRAANGEHSSDEGLVSPKKVSQITDPRLRDSLHSVFHLELIGSHRGSYSPNIIIIADRFLLTA